MKKRLVSLFLALLFIPLVIARCGGGGGASGPPYNPLWVMIGILGGEPVPTEVPTANVDLSGQAYCNNCPASVVGCTHLGTYYWADSPINVTWANHASGATGNTQHGVYESCGWFFGYFTYYRHLWFISVPLVAGDNVVEITASDATGISASDSVTVKRFPVTGLYGPRGIAVTASNEIFVASVSNAAIVVYSRTDSGNATPIRMISGPSTGLDYPQSIAMDFSGNVLVQNSSSITVYPAWVAGDTAPIRTITGASTGMASPRGIAVASDIGEIFVANSSYGAPSVTVYPLMATGDVAPTRTIKGAATGLGSPTDVGVDAGRNVIFVVDAQKNAIAVFERNASGDVPPIRTISGAATGLGSPAGIAVDAINNEVFVTNGGNSSITVYAQGASGDVAPIRTISGSTTGLSGPSHIAVDTINSEIFVTQGNASILVYSRTANGDVAPIRTITNPTQGL